MPVCSTGSGKTVVMTYAAQQHIASAHHYSGVLGIAHRGVLIAQMSNTFARDGIPHDIIGSQALIRTVVSEHMENFGRTFYNPRAQVKVASVDTLPNRKDLSAWLHNVGLVLGDEGHHYLADNKWGRVYSLVNPHANWMLPTATPERADGRGLGRQASGIVDDLVEGPSMQWLIDNGFLTPFRIRAPMPQDLDLSDVQMGSTGEYNQRQVRKAVHRSTKIVGDVVKTYTQHTPGMLGICFAVDIEHAQKIVAEFTAQGVAAALIDGTMPEEARRPIMRKYRAGEIKVLVNVDLFGEGFDLPAVEVVMFARPTASYALYAQQFGRALRLMMDRALIDQWDNYSVQDRLSLIARSAKPLAHIHDHVGNVLHFNGPPTVDREWSLDDRRGRRAPSDAEPIRICYEGCQQPYSRFLPECPYCGTPAPVPVERSLPEQVDGDLTLYTPEMLRTLFGVTTVEQAFAIKPSSFCAMPAGIVAKSPVGRAITARHEEKMREQQRLDQLLHVVMPPTRSPQENMRRFHYRYGVDIVQARMLGAADTRNLNERIIERLTTVKH